MKPPALVGKAQRERLGCSNAVCVLLNLSARRLFRFPISLHTGRYGTPAKTLV